MPTQNDGAFTNIENCNAWQHTPWETFNKLGCCENPKTRFTVPKTFVVFKFPEGPAKISAVGSTFFRLKPK